MPKRELHYNIDRIDRAIREHRDLIKRFEFHVHEAKPSDEELRKDKNAPSRWFVRDGNERIRSSAWSTKEDAEKRLVILEGKYDFLRSDVISLCEREIGESMNKDIDDPEA